MFKIIIGLLFASSTAFGTSYITGDAVRSPDRTKTWTMPATGGTLTKTTDNIATATALAADPADCASDTYATAINASGTLTCGTVTNAGLAGSIADSKLSQLTTSGKVANSATTATSANTNSAIVARDGSGNFSATTVTAAVTGTASGNLTYSANNHGVVLSSGTNAAVVLAPASSSTAVVTSGGSSADPTYKELPNKSYESTNCSLAASVATSALTIALKDGSGADATAASPCKISFRSSTAATGSFSTNTTSAALSTVISSGSTAGFASAVAGKIFVYAIDNAGTTELAWSQSIYDEGTRVSTTAEGGAGAADSGTTIYSTSARTNVGLHLLGRLTATEATAGTWATAPSEISNVPFRQSVISAIYQTDAGNTITNNTLTVINFEDKVEDTRNAVAIGAAWAFTAPEAGLYGASCEIIIGATSANSMNIYLYKNGVLYARVDRQFINATDTGGVGGTTTVRMAAGDTLNCRVIQVAGSSQNMSTTGSDSTMAIWKIGD